MNILYEANIGQSKVVDTLVSTSNSTYYRTLVFTCKSTSGEQIDLFIQFLNEKINLSNIAISSDVIILIAHNKELDPDHGIFTHIMTLVGARMLTCDSLKWGFVPNNDCDGYKFTIYLPTAHQSISKEELFDALKNNSKPSIERVEIKPQGVWMQLLVWLRIRRRRYRININGYEYEA